MSQPPNSHPHPNVQPRQYTQNPPAGQQYGNLYPPVPPPPAKKMGKLKAAGFGVIGLIVVGIIAGAMNSAPTPSPTPTVPAAPAASSAAPSHVPETKEPAPRKVETGSVFEWGSVKKEMRSRGFVVSGQEINNQCVDGADFTNGVLTIGLLVVNSCDETDTLDSMVDLLKENPGSYTHYLRGDNWIGTFESKSAARSFAVGTDLTVKAL